jgi:hypothetical protein
VPVVVDDGRPLDVKLTPPCIAVSYPREIGPSGDEQNFLLLDAHADVHADEPIRSAVGWLKPLRVTNREGEVTVFVYPRSAGDPTGAEVAAGFRLLDDGFTCCLGSVRGKLYEGRTSAGGEGPGIVLDAGELAFAAACRFVLQRDATGATALETDRATEVQWRGSTLRADKFTPIAIPRRGGSD